MFFIKKIVCLCLVIALLPACRKEKAQDTAATPRATPLTVNVVRTVSQEAALAFEYTGKAQGSKETEVRARVGGILMKRNYIEGSQVKEGQLLFEIDREPYKIALDQAKAQLDRQTADLKAAEKQWKRVRALGEKGFSSTKAQDDAEARVLSTRASIAGAKAAYDEAKLNYEYTRVTAPISGITSMEIHSEGTLISTQGDNGLLTTITQVDPVYVVFSVSDNELLKLGAMIEKGLVRNPRGKNEIRAKVRMGNGTVYEKDGTINFINPSVDQATGTLKLRAVFPNPQQKLIPGQFLRVTLEGLTRGNAVTLPKEAVQQGSNGSFVYVVDEEGKAAVRPVKTGYTAKTGEWIIDEGLEAGEMVILDNFVKIKPGLPVQIKLTDTAVSETEE